MFKKILNSFIIGVLVVGAYFGFVYYQTQQLIKEPLLDPIEYVIVLGAKVEGAAPSPFYQLRLDQAVQYLSAHPSSKVILTGGQGADEAYPESQIGQAYLQKQGIDPGRIKLETKSTNTFENLRFTRFQSCYE